MPIPFGTVDPRTGRDAINDLKHQAAEAGYHPPGSADGRSTMESLDAQRPPHKAPSVAVPSDDVRIHASGHH
ncbi:hypothetical protein GCM10009712_37390 [Pseudarthrobacter sulfonivorans]